MKNLIRKELFLAMHPTALIFLALSAMLLIPHYPYYVVFFYTGMAVFFTCLNGRENNDVFYTMTLPVAKKDIVKSRFTFVILLECAQIIIAIPFAFLRNSMSIPGNMTGMDANIALFGLSLIMLGIFNLLFFTIYYKDVSKVGTAFVLSSIAVFVYICIAETCVHAVPFVKNCLDTPDPMFMKSKLLILALGITAYIFLTYTAYLKSVSSFEKLDI